MISKEGFMDIVALKRSGTPRPHLPTAEQDGFALFYPFTQVRVSRQP
jgi:hypothetical protein